jgi:hypothetical protein
LPAGPGDKTAVLEAFKPGQEPAGSVPEDEGLGGQVASMVRRAAARRSSSVRLPVRLPATTML